MEQQVNPQHKSNQPIAYKKLQQENKRLKALLDRQAKELDTLRKFVGIGEKK